MAFTPAEKAKIKMYLGYPTLRRGELFPYGNIGSGGTEFAMVADYNLEQVEPEAEVLVRQVLERIDCIVNKLMPEGYDSQIIKRTGDVEFAGLQAMLAHNIAYAQETARLADLLHIPKSDTSELHARLGSGVGAVTECC